MKKEYILLVFVLFLLACPVNNYKIHTCKIDTLLNDSNDKGYFLLSRLLAIAFENSCSFRLKVQSLSYDQKNEFFNEIFVKNILEETIDEGLVKDYLSDITNDYSDKLEIENFETFISGLLNEDPLLVIKIPDWFLSYEWNAEKETPLVFVNVYGFDNKIYGFKANGACVEKANITEYDGIEIIVKTSEDYFLLLDKSFLNKLFHPCMEINSFVEDYCELWPKGILVKKRDIQKLYGECAPLIYTDTLIIQSDCPREEGIDANIFKSFKLSVPTIISTFNNDHCRAIEETYDFQIDFLYNRRIGENEVDNSSYLSIPYYGVRYSELIDEQGKVKMHEVLRDFEDKILNFTYFINDNIKEWDRDLYGESIVVLYHEIDFLDCETSVYPGFDDEIFYYAFSHTFMGKDEKEEAKFENTIHTICEKNGVVFGQNKILMGWHYINYCEAPTTFHSTGVQALETTYEIKKLAQQ